MKPNLLLALSTWFAAASLFAATPEDFVAQGRTALAAHDLVSANFRFNSALALDTNHPAANLLAAATRLLLLPQQPAGSNFLTKLGIPIAGRDIYNWTANFQKDTNGHLVLPNTVNSSEAVALYQSQVVPAVQAALQKLGRITSTSFLLTLTSEETAAENVTLDYGDVLLLRGLLHGAQFLGYTLNAHNFNVVINHLNDLAKADQATVQRVLADYPTLLAQASATERLNSKAAFTNAILRYQEASAFIRTVRPAGADRLFTLLPEDEAKEAEVRDYLDTVLASVNGPVPLPPRDALAPWLNAGVYFTGARSLRSLLPQFNGDNYVHNSLPDYTFGGLLLNEPACDTEGALREHLSAPSFAGCYAGSMSGWSGEYKGQFAMFVQTNNRAVFLGYDINNSSGIFSEFTLRKSGGWDYSSDSLTSWGNIHEDKSLDGGFWSPSDDAWFWGNLIPAANLFQNSAGYYTGTWQGSGHSGQLKAVLSADGALVFTQFDPSGVAADGGSGQLESDNSLNTDSVQGVHLTGKLNPTSLSISGTTSDGFNDGTFRLTRSAFVVSDRPPSLTALPKSRTNALGDTVTFSVAAAGSPPLCYQWYSNAVAIGQATAATLVVSNVQFSSAATYSVAVRNVAGTTNAAATLTVVPERVLPTVVITAPVAGQRWSNSLFNVTGTATDNVAVAQVWGQVNNEAWVQANGTNHWDLQAHLVQRTNSLRVVAFDTTGNASRTNQVSFIFVPSGLLTVQIVGQGSVTPNYGGAVLELGKTFSMTATPASGFQFVNWTAGLGGPIITNKSKVSFPMTANLVLTANFVDVAPPTLTITAPTSSQRLSSATTVVSGKASDNARVASVQYRLNGIGWAPAQLTTNWQAPVTLRAGTNTLEAYATDATGNLSPTGKVSFVYVSASPLTLLTNGLGTIGRSFSGNLLEVGKGYTVTAVPGVGQLFSNWSGTITAATNPLSFFMQSNMVIQANFVTNLFLGATGSYYGLFYPSSGQSASNSGHFTLTLSGPGTFSGRLLLAGTTLPFSSNFTVAGRATLPVARPGASPLWLIFDLLPTQGRITGLVDGGAWSASLLADRAATTNLLTGNYSLAMAGAAGGADSPVGIGIGQLTVAADASVQVSGTLADSTGLSQQTGVSLAGQWPLYSSLYGGRGLLMGWMQLNTNAPALWLKPAVAGDRYYSNGFAQARDVVVARYRAPTAGQRVVNWTNGLVIVGGGNLPGPLTNRVVLTNNQFRVIGGGISNLTVSLTLTNGAFTGSFKHPVTRSTTNLRGTVVQDPLGTYPVGSGGWFLGTNQGGYLLIQPVTP